MWSGLFPERASSIAARVDALYIFLLVVSGFFALLISVLVVYFAIRYRRRHDAEIGSGPSEAPLLEAIWTVVPLVISLVIFVWGASLFVWMYAQPAEALQVYVVGKQWMWKFQHLDGQREIDELHVPINRVVKLTMTSEDVIHSLFIPAFRVKMDVIPGRYRTVWFEGTRPGTYHLFCAEYCGTQHSHMIGQVVVMEPNEYQTWLSGGAPEGSLASTGEKLFRDLACNTCHQPDSQGRGPVLQGLFGKTIQLDNGDTIAVDEAYLRESILNPARKVTAGFQPVMPTFQGLITEEQLLALVEYIKSLKGTTEVPPAPGGPAGPRPGEATPAMPPVESPRPRSNQLQ